MKQKNIIIGSRGSKLSLVQTNFVKKLLELHLPDRSIEVKIIKTKGDKNMNPIPLDTVGKGWFTKEIDKQLLDKKIDIAVHSLKDLLDTLPPGLAITAIPQREDAREALISHDNFLFKDLKKGATVGTDSIRRKVQLLKIRPDIQVKSLRGNVLRRLEKLNNKEYDAIMLAVAGLKRLGLENKISQHFGIKEIIPSPGQGALAIVSREADKALNRILSQLNHNPSVIAVTAEREFSRVTGGGCSMPIGAYGQIKGEVITLFGMIGSEDAKHVAKGYMQADIKNPKGLAQKLAHKLLKQASPWYQREKLHVVLTSAVKENDVLIKELEALGLIAVVCPSISVSKNLSSQAFKIYVKKLTTYDWVIFTSSNGVKFFMELLLEMEKDIASLKHIKIAAVGEKTAETAKTHGLSVSYIPSTFTTRNVISEMPIVKGKKILLPRSNIGNPEFKKRLEELGAKVTDMPVYKTEYTKSDLKEFKKRIQENQILCMWFTSPSTVNGFLKNINKILLKKVLSLPVLSIGPVTRSSAKAFGFKKIYTANIHTKEGMLTKLKEVFYNT